MLALQDGRYALGVLRDRHGAHHTTQAEASHLPRFVRCPVCVLVVYCSTACLVRLAASLRLSTGRAHV